MVGPVIVPHPNTIRGPIESEYNALRDAIEKKYVSDRVALEDKYLSDLAENAAAKREALLDAGLNSDGSTPLNYPESSDPEDLTVPTITGTAVIGQELTAVTGTWERDPTFTYQWQRADADGSNNVAITNATNSTYTLVEADVGKKLRVTVTGTNIAGTGVASSVYTDVVLPLPPENTVAPTITGTPTVGEVLTAHDGTWSGDPVFAYQWVRTDADGSNPADIADADDATYTLVLADSGKKVRVTVTGTNDGGDDVAQSALTEAVAAA